jgi:hypothetical protein
MKTQKEIEQLAESIYHYKFSPNPFVVQESIGYINGYNQCQEDMDKKYTEEDIKKAFMAGCQSERRFSRRIDELDKYINSLNKQDNENTI